MTDATTFGSSMVPALLLVCVISVVAGAAGLFSLTHLRDARDESKRPDFIALQLGAPSKIAPLVRRPTRHVEVSLGRHGTQVRHGDASVQITAEGAGTAAWRRFARGASRQTPFGSETVTIDGARAEEFLTVDRHHGRRVWRWRLSGETLNPKLRKNGAIDLTSGRAKDRLRIAPVEIYDVHGNDVTPAGSRWSLRRDGGAWSLELDLDDSKLPLPYVIDPAVDYPATQYFSMTGSTAITGGIAGTIVNAAGTLCNTCPAVSISRQTAAPKYYQFLPSNSTGSTTNTGTASLTPNGQGWVVDADGSAAPNETIIPAGTWTFRLRTTGNQNSTGTTRLAVGLWKVTTSAGSISSSTCPSEAATLARRCSSAYVTASSSCSAADLRRWMTLTACLAAMTPSSACGHAKDRCAPRAREFIVM